MSQAFQAKQSTLNGIQQLAVSNLQRRASAIFLVNPEWDVSPSQSAEITSFRYVYPTIFE